MGRGWQAVWVMAKIFSSKLKLLMNKCWKFQEDILILVWFRAKWLKNCCNQWTFYGQHYQSLGLKHIRTTKMLKTMHFFTLIKPFFIFIDKTHPQMKPALEWNPHFTPLKNNKTHGSLLRIYGILASTLFLILQDFYSNLLYFNL